MNLKSIDDEIISKKIKEAQCLPASEFRNISENDKRIVMDVVRELFKSIFENAKFDDSTELFEFGDSIEVMNLIGKLKKYLGITLNIADIFDHPSVISLTDFLLQNKENQSIIQISKFLGDEKND